MDWNPKSIREFLEEIGGAAREQGMAHVSLTLASGDHINVSFHPPPPPPPPIPTPLSASEEAEIRFKRAQAEIELQYGHTGHVPTKDEVLEWMALRGQV